MSDPKSCKHGRLIMDRCVDCGAQVFHLPPMPGESLKDAFALNMNETIAHSRELASALSGTISAMARRHGNRMPMTIVFTALRLVRQHAMKRSGIRDEEVQLLERGVDHVMAPAPPARKEEGH